MNSIESVANCVHLVGPAAHCVHLMESDTLRLPFRRQSMMPLVVVAADAADDAAVVAAAVEAVAAVVAMMTTRTKMMMMTMIAPIAVAVVMIPVTSPVELRTQTFAAHVVDSATAGTFPAIGHYC